ncbi:MAG TPA: LPS export ABC transporter permease LptF [Acidobacteriota bacterium]|jgi:LPS export ABC transporter permease LptF/LPS export ABC transporter permease LptG
MRSIDRCIYKELVGPLLISLTVLTFIVFTREFGRFAEILIRKSAEPATILQVCLALLPSILIFTIPISFLIGTLIAFSRLSSDSEIIALRACGISMFRLLSPVLKIGLVVFVLTVAMTFYLLPRGNRQLRELQYSIGIRPVINDIRPRVFNESISNIVLYVEEIQYQRGLWSGVFVVDNSVPNEQRIILARYGRIVPQPESGRFQFHFDQGTSYKVDMQDFTKDDLSRFESLEMVVETADETPPQTLPLKTREKGTFDLLKQRGSTPQEQRRTWVELNSRLALPLSTFAFAFLGLGLGVNTRRGGRAYGFIIGILIAFTYYILFVTGSNFAKDTAVPVWLGVWGSNLLLYGAGLLALRFMNTDSPWMRAVTDNRMLLGGLEALHQGYTELRRIIARKRARNNTAVSSLRVGFLKVIDLYLIKEFLKYFALALIVSVALFDVFTLFELMDDIIRNHISLWLVLDYFWFLLPHILTLVVPMTVLIATLVNFGMLDRTNQVTSLKASGVSVYRLAVPILLTAALVSSFLFVMQDYVLPFANQKQDNLRNIIKGRPVRTFFHPERPWTFGQKHRLYNYVRFDSTRKIFAQLSIYDLDISANYLNSKIFASRAVWDPAKKIWVLHQGFIRNFNDPAHGLTRFEEMQLKLPEEPSYFVKEVKESTKMKYLELKNYIQTLQLSGFDVEELRVELYKKISFPVVSIIMAMIGVPFAFSMGRKGALYGLAVSILIGIIYWGTFGVFEVMGASGMLAPVLAAWAPNLLFGIGGLYLLFTIRT